MNQRDVFPNNLPDQAAGLTNWGLILSILAAFLCGMIVYAVYKKFSASIMERIQKRWAYSRRTALKVLACVVSSLALTAYVDLFALNSVWAKLSVFVCALAVCLALTYAAGHLFKSAPPFKMVLQAAVAAALTLTVFHGTLFPRGAQEVLITLISETAGEICLADLVIDEKNCPISEADVVENSGWLYRGQYDNFMIRPEKDGVENHLTMRFFAKEVHVGFPYTPYAGSVTIQSSTGSEETLDLRCPEWEEGEAVQYADIPIDCRRVYAPLEMIVCNTGFLLILSFVFLAMRYAAGLAWREIPMTASDTAGRAEPKPAASEKRPAPTIFNRESAHVHRPPPQKRDYSLLPLWLAVVVAAALFTVLYWQSYFPQAQGVSPEPAENAPLRETKEIYQLDTNLYDVYISVFPTAGESGNTLDLSAFELHTAGDHSYNPTLNCNIQILPEGQTPDPRLDLNRKNATIRVRGNTSRGAPYKSYKVRLDSECGDFYGQTVLNINKGYWSYDATRMATKLSTDLLAGLDHVTGYRSYFMRLWIRDASLPAEEQEFEYQGLHVELEQPNKAYFRARGLGEPAALYKARSFSFYPNDVLLDVDDTEYSQDAFEQVLDIQEGGGSHQNLLEMLDAVGDTSRDFEEVFTEYFNEDNYLTWLAFNLLMGNTDIVSQNYLLYNPENSRTWYFIHWDFDGGLLFGEFASNAPESLRGIQGLMASRLHRRYFQEIPGSIEKLDVKMRELLDTYIIRERVTALVEAYKSVLEKASAPEPSPDLRRYTLDQWLTYLDGTYDGILCNYDMFNNSRQYPLSGYVAEPMRNSDGSVRFAWEPFCSLAAPPVSYSLRVYSDCAMQDMVYEITGLQETSFLLEEGLPDGTYYVWVSGTDSEGREQISLEYVTAQSGGKAYGLRAFTLK